MHAMLLKN